MIMFMIGKNLVTSNDVMQIITEEEIVKQIKEIKGDLYDKISQLRAIKLVDLQLYKRLKTQLPYFVCGLFKPGIRKKENFAYTQYFVIDIDHISKSDKELYNLKNRLCNDQRVFMLFISPGQDGLKLMFKLSDKISDSGYYSIFYKKFSYTIAEEYNLYGVLDIKTSDVSRCCFLSIDEEIYYNENCIEIDPQLYVNEESYQQEIKLLSLNFQEKSKNSEELHLEEQSLYKDSKEPGNDIMQQIRDRINPLKVKKEKIIFQPEELDRDWQKMEKVLVEYNMTVETVNKISYGKQIKVRVQNEWAEINIFYGKKGYSFVATTKTGSNAELGQMIVTVLKTNF